MHRIAFVSACALLAACHASVDVGDDDANKSDNVHIAMKGDGTKDHVSIEVPGLSAKVSLPGLDLGSHVDLDSTASRSRPAPT